MLVTFRTKAHANITMFGDVAVTLLKLAGHSGTVPSAILAQDIPAALVKLEGGLPLVPMRPRDGHDGLDAADDPDAEPKVPLRRRATPLLELLRAADAAGTDVLIDATG
jgi:Domain of unknown function (DUF1840)